MDRRAFFASGALLAVAAGGTARAAGAGAPFVTDARATLGAWRAAVEEHLGGVLRALGALAATSDAGSGLWARARPALGALAAGTPTAAAVWLARPDGAYYTVAGGLTGETLKDRDYFPGLMAGRPVTNALVVSKSTGHRSIVVAAPVTRGGRVVGALGASVRARLVSDAIEAAAHLPADLVFYALDPTGRTAIHKDPELMFQFPSDLGDASLKAGVARILGGREGVVEYDFRGTHRTAVFERSAVTGWSFVLAQVGA